MQASLQQQQHRTLSMQLQPQQQQRHMLLPRRAVPVLQGRSGGVARPAAASKGGRAPDSSSSSSTSTLSSKKAALQQQLARQEAQQRKTLAGSRTTRGLSTTGSRPSGGTPQQQQQQPTRRRGSRFYFNITGFPFPLGPFFERNTVCTEVVKGQIWTFEQTQAFFFDVFTPVRMTVIKLRSGGLWVHAPVAPTQECINMLRDLGAPVEYIVLPTFAYEHKVFVGPFSRRFPDAKVYVTPFQWSFPLNLPPQFFGIFPAGELADDGSSEDGSELPWADEIETKLLAPPPIGVSEAVRLTEASFFHKATRTLLVTDAVVYVDRDPPAVIPAEALRAQAQDGWLQRYLAGGRSRQEVDAVARRGRVPDDAESRRTAWARMSLLVLYFNPSDLLTPQASFDAIAGRLLVGPVVRTLVYNKIPNTVCDWVDAMSSEWRFERIIPAHFSAPVRAGPADLQAAFKWCYELAGRSPGKAAAAAPVVGNPFGNLFGGWRLGGSGNGSGNGSSSSSSKSSSGGGKKQRGSGKGGGDDVDAFPAEDVAVLKGLNDALLRLKVVYDDAEQRQ